MDFFKNKKIDKTIYSPYNKTTKTKLDLSMNDNIIFLTTFL